MSYTMNSTSWKSETNADISESEESVKSRKDLSDRAVQGLLSRFHILVSLQTLQGFRAIKYLTLK